MPRFAANLSTLYPDLPFLDRFEAAAKDGFRALEYLFPYAYPVSELRSRLQANGLQQVLINTPAGGKSFASINDSWGQGWRGTACLKSHQADFRTGLEIALEYATALNCPQIHVMVGIRPEGVGQERADETLFQNLDWAAHLAAQSRTTLLIEPINPRTIPNFHLQYQAHAHQIVATVAADNLKVQMDLFHCQIVEGDLTTRISQYLPTGRVGHIQIADVPSRHEPGTGEVNWPYLFKLIDQLTIETGWSGWLGCEYNPSDPSPGGTSRGLSWLRSAQNLN